jgi:hypothetical protein
VVFELFKQLIYIKPYYKVNEIKYISDNNVISYFYETIYQLNIKIFGLNGFFQNIDFECHNIETKFKKIMLKFDDLEISLIDKNLKEILENYFKTKLGFKDIQCINMLNYILFIIKTDYFFGFYDDESFGVKAFDFKRDLPNLLKKI